MLKNAASAPVRTRAPRGGPANPPPSGAGASDAKGIASVETAARLLRLLEASPQPLSLTEIAMAIGFAPGKTHHYLVSLVRSGLVRRERDGLRYQLGGFALQLGLAALGRTGLNAPVASALRHLRDETGHTSLFVVWSERGPLVTHCEEATAAMSVSLRLGTVLPMLKSPSAAVFIAWLPDAMLRPVLEELPDGALPLKRLVAIREQTRREGGAHASGARSPQIAGVSAPVFGLQRELVGAMTMLGLVGEFDDRPGSAASKALHAHADALSRFLGER